MDACDGQGRAGGGEPDRVVDRVGVRGGRRALSACVVMASVALVVWLDTSNCSFGSLAPLTVTVLPFGSTAVRSNQ